MQSLPVQGRASVRLLIGGDLGLFMRITHLICRVCPWLAEAAALSWFRVLQQGTGQPRQRGFALEARRSSRCRETRTRLAQKHCSRRHARQPEEAWIEGLSVPVLDVLLHVCLFVGLFFCLLVCLFVLFVCLFVGRGSEQAARVAATGD